MPVRFTVLKPYPKPVGAPQPPPQPQAETIMLDSRVGSVASTHPLVKGAAYTLTVTGTYSAWNEPLTDGTPEPNATYPTSGSVRDSTEVGIDADTLFASPHDHPHPPGHWATFQLDIGSGFSHHEPVGGPYTKPAAGHSYTYHLTGEGQPLRAHIQDSPLSDNYGALRIVIK